MTTEVFNDNELSNSSDDITASMNRPLFKARSRAKKWTGDVCVPRFNQPTNDPQAGHHSLEDDEVVDQRSILA